MSLDPEKLILAVLDGIQASLDIIRGVQDLLPTIPREVVEGARAPMGQERLAIAAEMALEELPRLLAQIREVVRCKSKG